MIGEHKKIKPQNETSFILGDPANADVYLFSVEGKVFMICAHGEGDGSVKNRPLLTALLASVKKS